MRDIRQRMILKTFIALMSSYSKKRQHIIVLIIKDLDRTSTYDELYLRHIYNVVRWSNNCNNRMI